MESVNIVQSPGVVGNISGCTVNTTTVVLGRRNLFIENIADVTTNSCTGEVNMYPRWQFSDEVVSISMLLFIAIMVATLFWFANRYN